MRGALPACSTPSRAISANSASSARASPSRTRARRPSISGAASRRGTARPWGENALTCVFSSTKGAAAILVHLRLARRGLVDLDAPVRGHWPGTRRRGRGRTTLAMMPRPHGGRPALRAAVKPGGARPRLHGCAPPPRRRSAEPGTRSAYHALTFADGWRAFARPGRVGDWFRGEIAGPRPRFHIGVREAEDRRCRGAVPREIRAPQTAPRRDAAAELKTILTQPGSIPALAFLNNGGLNPEISPERIAPRSPRPAASPMRGDWRSSTRPLALGEDLLRSQTIARLARVSSATHFDATLQTGVRFGLGVMRSADSRAEPVPQRRVPILGETPSVMSARAGRSALPTPMPASLSVAR
ncbi:MAG: serine hydrolase domain-containing protein [Alphaproteobacteria bacterium]